MEASVKAVDVLAPPQAEVAPSLNSDNLDDGAVVAAAPSLTFDPMDEFRQRLEDIISGYGSAAHGLLEKQMLVDAEMEKMEETQEETAVTMETDISDIMRSLERLSSPEEKLKDLVQKYSEMAALRRRDEKKLRSLQQTFNLLLDERKQLQVEQHHSGAARSQMESLCRDLQSHYSVLRAEAVRHRQEDEEKRNDITRHFQNMLTEIQDQIEQHNSRNEKLCHENTSLTTKLESLMNQCELREESLEKVNRHRDLQHKLTEAKLQQANALLAEAQEKHQREKEYLLMEAIDKTKKCFALKEDELNMKKKLTLYSQKFDEFQETLSKSNEIYVRFKKEMDHMSEKMKKMEKESNLWKTRFENCNKALTDMIQERSERNQDYDLLVLKIQRLEKLCRALQDERAVLYHKIKDVRRTNASVSSKLRGFSEADDAPPALTQDLEDPERPEDPVLSRDLARLREEQLKLQEFAAALLDRPAEDDEDGTPGHLDEDAVDEDAVAAALAAFRTKPQEPAEPTDQQEVKTESFCQTQRTTETPAVEPDTDDVEPQVDVEEHTENQVRTEDKAEPKNKNQKKAEVPAEHENRSPAAPEPEAAQAKAEGPVKEEEMEPEQNPQKPSESENTWRTSDTSKKQTPKKKKKKTGRV